MDLDDICRQSYFHEVNRRQQLNNSVSLPSGVLTLLAGAEVSIFKSTSAPYSAVDCILLGCMIFLALSLLASAISLMFSVYPRKYSYVPTPQEFQQYRDKLKNYYRNYRDASDRAERETLQFVQDEYAEKAHKNVSLNDDRTRYLGYANSFLILSLLIAVPVVVCYVMITVPEASPTLKIEMADANT